MKRHIEQPPSPSLLFGYMPAYCGKRRRGDYRMFPKDDEIAKRARLFFVARTRPKDATCETCKKIYYGMN